MPSISFSIYEGVRRVLALNCPAISVMIVISTFQLHAMTELTEPELYGGVNKSAYSRCF